jgi:hypothetical protein
MLQDKEGGEGGVERGRADKSKMIDNIVIQNDVLLTVPLCLSVMSSLSANFSFGCIFACNFRKNRSQNFRICFLVIAPKPPFGNGPVRPAEPSFCCVRKGSSYFY